jgi:hypothetical protein
MFHMLLEGKVIPNSMSAEPMAGVDCNTSDDDNPLTQDAKSTGNPNRPRLRIVHSADRFPVPAPVNMPPPDRRRHNSTNAADRQPAMLDRTIQAQIGRLLRDVFSDVAAEPVPKRFVTLLAELEAKEKRR